MDSVMKSQIGARVLIWGSSGTGKTFFGLTFPKVMVFDFDGGMLTSLHPDLPEFVDCKDYSTIIGSGAFPQFVSDWKKALKRDDIDTLFIDSLTTLADHIMRQVMKLANKAPTDTPQIQHWGSLINQIKQLFYAAIAEAGDKNLVISAHSQMNMTSDGTLDKYVPLIAGKKLPDQVGLWFDEMYHSEVVGMQQKRVFQVATVGCKRYDAKSRISALAGLNVFEPNDWRVIQAKVASAHEKRKGE